MKQIIVLVATIILGLALSGFIVGFSDDAEDLAGNVSTGIDKLSTEMEDRIDDMGF
ncbi:MAG: hypothetical protein PHW03_00825 [Eubacteriales bacterium]|nr:hypothetical protein [Eubacteriales bacterium]MDD4389325.1 hypothetical protein [Eubacteriales bacterium]